VTDGRTDGRTDLL